MIKPNERKPRPYEMQQLERRIRRLESQREQQQETRSEADERRVRKHLIAARELSHYSNTSAAQVINQLADAITELRFAIGIAANIYENEPKPKQKDNKP